MTDPPEEQSADVAPPGESARQARTPLPPLESASDRSLKLASAIEQARSRLGEQTVASTGPQSAAEDLTSRGPQPSTDVLAPSTGQPVETTLNDTHAAIAQAP